MMKVLQRLKGWFKERFENKASQRHLLRANRRAFKKTSYRGQLAALRRAAPAITVRESRPIPQRRPEPPTRIAEVEIRPLSPPEESATTYDGDFPKWDLRGNPDE